jgi:hypothetical protein
MLCLRPNRRLHAAMYAHTLAPQAMLARGRGRVMDSMH